MVVPDGYVVGGAYYTLVPPALVLCWWPFSLSALVHRAFWCEQRQGGLGCCGACYSRSNVFWLSSDVVRWYLLDPGLSFFHCRCCVGLPLLDVPSGVGWRCAFGCLGVGASAVALWRLDVLCDAAIGAAWVTLVSVSLLGGLVAWREVPCSRLGASVGVLCLVRHVPEAVGSRVALCRAVMAVSVCLIVHRRGVCKVAARAGLSKCRWSFVWWWGHMWKAALLAAGKEKIIPRRSRC